MTQWLLRRFIKKNTQTSDPAVRKQVGIMSSIVGIMLNLMLFTVKFIMGTLASSIAIVSDGFNNLSDSASCIITFFGYRMAAKPADKDHPFGHGRMEYLTALAIAIIILLVGVELFKGSLNKMIHPVPIQYSHVILASLLLSVILKFWMSRFNRTLGRQYHSSVMLATSKDSLNDVIATSATIIALLASPWTTFPLDGLMGCVVSLFVLVSGIGIIRETANALIGQPLDKETVQAVTEMITDRPLVLGVHDLLIHNYGPGKQFGSAHVEVSAKETVLHIHDTLDEIEHAVYDSFGILLTLHADPVEEDDVVLTELKQTVNAIVKAIHPLMTAHDIRITKHADRTDLSLDIVVPYDCPFDNDTLQTQIEEQIQNATCFPYHLTITFDRDFTG